jgi:hypothetical protein
VIFVSKAAASSAKPKPTLLRSSRGLAGKLELIAPPTKLTAAAKSIAAHHLGYEIGAFGSVHNFSTGRRLLRKNPTVVAAQWAKNRDGVSSKTLTAPLVIGLLQLFGYFCARDCV